jgi:outer membrane protein OmpA-like peptidoglycan-associated protein
MKRILIALSFALVLGASVGAQVNVTGTWTLKSWTIRPALQQDGDRVWGYGGAKDFWFRGHWDGTRLVLVVNGFREQRKGACTPRGVFVLTGKTVSALQSTWFQPGRKPLTGAWTRVSADAGEKVDYPYAMELEYCGMLRTYELAFASGSDTLSGTDWPILAAVADLLKKNAAAKIEVAGHTDSTGDAKKNQALSEGRAAAVKSVLVSKYGADGARITTKGWGVEQPVEDNATEDGRDRPCALSGDDEALADPGIRGRCGAPIVWARLRPSVSARAP